MLGLELSWFWWIILLLAILVGSFIYLMRPVDFYKDQNIRGPKFSLFSLSQIGKKPMWEWDEELLKEFGNIVALSAFGRQNLIIADIDMMREICIKEFESFGDRQPLTNRGLLKHGVFDMTGEGWKHQRHQLSPYFTSGNLKMSTASINRVLDNLIGWLETKCDQGEMLEAREFSLKMSLDIICSTAYGVEVNSAQNPDLELLAKARETFEQLTAGNFLFLLSFIFPKFGKLLDLLNIQSLDFSYFIQFTRQLIKQRKENPQKDSHDFINTLLHKRKDLSKGLSDDEMIANATLFLVAGYDTTASALAFYLYNLTVHPEWQEKVYQQIDEHLGNQVFDQYMYSQPAGTEIFFLKRYKPRYEDVQKMTYLDMSMEESLRLYPLASRVERYCTRDTEVKGVLIKKNTNVVFPVWHFHRKPEIWEDPETFDPLRFTPEKKKAREPLYYAPFGVGPRHCIGMRLAQFELKIAAVRILQKFRLVKNEKTQVPLQLSPKAFQVVAKDGIWLSLQRRE